VPHPPIVTAKVAEAAAPSVEVVDLDTLIRSEAKKHHIDYATFWATLDCESLHFRDVKMQSTVPSKTGPNGHENSWGIAQIWLDPRGHPEVTRAEAQDPQFAVEWAATRFEQGYAREWTCYRNL
jgi:hypothetical protein